MQEQGAAGFSVCSGSIFYIPAMACPKGIPLEFIAALNRDLIRAAFRRHREPLVILGWPRHPAHEEM
jgi:hypothetical protein